MAADVKELEEQALKLPEKDRATLAEQLIRSLDSNIDSDVEEAWLEEAERRYKAYLNGDVEAIDAEDVFRKARSEIK